MPDTHTGPRKAVKTISITNTQINGAAIVSAPHSLGTQVATDSVAGFGDPTFSNIPRAIASYDPLTIGILDEGGDPPVAGTVGDVTIQVTYWDGTQTATRSFTKKCTITQVAPSTVQIDGEHKATWDLTFMPVGGDALSVENNG